MGTRICSLPVALVDTFRSARKIRDIRHAKLSLNPAPVRHLLPACNETSPLPPSANSNQHPGDQLFPHHCPACLHPASSADTPSAVARTRVTNPSTKITLRSNPPSTVSITYLAHDRYTALHECTVLLRYALAECMSFACAHQGQATGSK